MVLSVVVPVYNKENLITECVNSLCRMSGFEFEILLVDDGSNDNSLQVCNELAQQDLRIKVISQENQGVSVARNTGVQVATGEYIVFLDADDFVSEEFQKQIQCAQLYNVDMCIAGYSRFRGGNVVSENRVAITPGKYDDVHILDAQIAGLEICMLSVWCTFYRKRIILENGLSFRKGMKSCEDFLFNLEYLPHVQNFAVIDGVGYCYRENGESVTATRPLSHADDYEYVFGVAKNYLDRQGVTLEQMELFRCRWIRWTAALVYNWKEQKFLSKSIWEKLNEKSFYEFSLEVTPEKLKSIIEYRLIFLKADNIILLYFQCINILKKILRKNDL